MAIAFSPSILKGTRAAQDYLDALHVLLARHHET
jgi:hypothetical protein